MVFLGLLFSFCVLFFLLLFRLRQTDSVYVYHYTRCFKLHFLLQPSSTLNSKYLSCGISVVLQCSFKIPTFCYIIWNDCRYTITTTKTYLLELIRFSNCVLVSSCTAAVDLYSSCEQIANLFVINPRFIFC